MNKKGVQFWILEGADKELKKKKVRRISRYAEFLLYRDLQRLRNKEGRPARKKYNLSLNRDLLDEHKKAYKHSGLKEKYNLNARLNQLLIFDDELDKLERKVREEKLKRQRGNMSI